VAVSGLDAISTFIGYLSDVYRHRPYKAFLVAYSVYVLYF
jgi:hypothetical protein